MRFFTPFVTAIVSIVFCDAVLSHSHSSDSSLRKRHPRRLDNSSSTDVSLRSEGAVLEKRFGPDMRFSYYAVGLGACGQESSPGDFVVALNVEQYGSGGYCFETITITYNGKSTQATICMGCPYGALDFSSGLFQYFADESLGYIYGSWEFGSGAPATTSTPKPTSTYKPTPTSTYTPPPTTTSTSTKKTSTSSTSTSSSVPKTSTSATSTSTSATPSATPSPTPTDVFDLLGLVLVNLGNVAAAGVLVGEGNLSLLLAAPLVALANLHGNAHHNRHVGIAKRHSPDIQLFQRSYTSARWTYYEVGLGACGITNVAADFIVALNSDQYGSGYPGPYCFKTITMEYNGLTTTAQVTDECPGCPYGGLDLSEGLFQFFSPLSTGVLYGTWYFNDDASAGSPSSSSSTYVAPTTTKHKTTSSSTYTPPSTTYTPTSTPTSTKESSTSSTPSSTSSSSSSSSSAASSSHSSSSSSSSKSSSSSATPSATPSAPAGTNLADLSQIILDLGVMVVAGADH
ncbi:hypothetical protein H0H92_011518 [Tricholoma furcatifolium]|nr:hypothetical protein H0H92_011518 [Tricholoma furcatifolium]